MPRRNLRHCGGKAKSHFCRSRQIKIALMQFLSGNRIGRQTAAWARALPYPLVFDILRSLCI
jgi:hypothetical protein